MELQNQSSPTVDGSTTETKNTDPAKITNPLEMSYETERQSLKFGVLMSAYLMFQSTVGISVFCLQKPFSDAGLLWSLAISAFCCYVTTYGLLTILKLVHQMESENEVKKRYQNLYSACHLLKGPHVPILKWLMTFACVGMMLTSTVSNLMMTTQSTEYAIGKYKCTFMIFVIISLLLIVIIEPEKIKGFTTLTTIIVMAVATIFTLMNFSRFFTGQSSVKISEIPMVRFENTFTLTGNLIYAFELCSCYLSLRLTSSESVNYEWLTKRMMIFITFVYFVAGASFSLAFKPSEIHENAFEIYNQGFFRYFTFAYMLNTVYNFLTNTIFACETLETIGWIRKLLVDEQDSLQRRKLVIFRLIMWAFSIALSLVSGDQVTRFLNFSGSVFSPIVGFIGPLVYFYTYKINKGETILPWRKLHDTIYVIVCIWISIMGMRAAF